MLPRQYVGPGVGGALTNQEVPVVSQQFLGIAAAHLAVVPRLALQLLLRSEGQRAHEKRAGVVYGCYFVKTRHLGLGRPLDGSVVLSLNGVLKGLWRSSEENSFHICWDLSFILSLALWLLTTCNKQQWGDEMNTQVL